MVQSDEGRIQAHLDEVARQTVEETLNGLLDAEAARLCGARKYERTEGGKDTRAGGYDRYLQARAGKVTVKVPKLRSLTFETAVIERYRRRQSSVEEALIEMHLAGAWKLDVNRTTWCQALLGIRLVDSTDRLTRVATMTEKKRRRRRRSISSPASEYGATETLGSRLHREHETPAQHSRQALMSPLQPAGSRKPFATSGRGDRTVTSYRERKQKNVGYGFLQQAGRKILSVWSEMRQFLNMLETEA